MFMSKRIFKGGGTFTELTPQQAKEMGLDPTHSYTVIVFKKRGGGKCKIVKPHLFNLKNQQYEQRGIK